MKLIEAEQPFLITDEYKRFKEFCDACKKYKYIGLCYGSAGIGKTLSAKYYSSWDLINSLYDSKKDVFANPSTPFPEDMKEINTIYYTVEVANTPLRIKYSLEHEISKLYTVQAEVGYYKLNVNKNAYSEEEYNSIKNYFFITSEKSANFIDG